jgi:hypothetical protein
MKNIFQVQYLCNENISQLEQLVMQQKQYLVLDNNKYSAKYFLHICTQIAIIQAYKI